MSPFGGELELEGGGFECVDDFNVEGDKAMIEN